MFILASFKGSDDSKTDSAGISPIPSSCSYKLCVLSSTFLFRAPDFRSYFISSSGASSIPSLICLWFCLLSKYKYHFKKKKSCFDRDLKLHPSQEINNKCSQSNLTLPRRSHSGQYSSVFHSKPEWHRAAQQLLAAALLSRCQIQTQDCWISSSFCSWTPDADCCASRCSRWFPRCFPQRNLWALSSKMTGRRWQQPRDYACASRKYVMEAKEIRLMGVL